MKVCLVGSSGGHLTHLYMLKPFWKDAAGFVLNLLYGICGSIGMILAGLGGFAAFLALLDGSYAQAAASALVALLLCPFAAPMLLSLAGSALIVAAAALFAWLF